MRAILPEPLYQSSVIRQHPRSRTEVSKTNNGKTASKTAIRVLSATSSEDEKNEDQNKNKTEEAINSNLSVIAGISAVLLSVSSASRRSSIQRNKKSSSASRRSKSRRSIVKSVSIPASAPVSPVAPRPVSPPAPAPISKPASNSLLTLDEGYEPAMKRLSDLGMRTSPTQPNTRGDGNCFPYSLEDQIEEKFSFFPRMTTLQLRQNIVDTVLQNISNERIMWPYPDEDPLEWKERMSQDKVYVDYTFVQLTAIYLKRDVVIVPVFEESASIGGMFNIYKADGENGRLQENKPLTFLYYEEWRFSCGGHFQSITALEDLPSKIDDYIYNEVISVLPTEEASIQVNSSILPTEEASIQVNSAVPDTLEFLEHSAELLRTSKNEDALIDCLEKILDLDEITIQMLMKTKIGAIVLKLRNNYEGRETKIGRRAGKLVNRFKRLINQVEAQSELEAASDAFVGVERRTITDGSTAVERTASPMVSTSVERRTTAATGSTTPGLSSSSVMSLDGLAFNRQKIPNNNCDKEGPPGPQIVTCKKGSKCPHVVIFGRFHYNKKSGTLTIPG